MNKGLVTFFVVLILGLWFAVSVGGAYSRHHELGEKITDLLKKIDKENHDEIKNDVVAAAAPLDILITSADVTVAFEPTAATSVPQNILSKLAEFENYRAEIVCYAPVRAWGITFSREPIQRWQTVQVKATWKPNRELEKAIEQVDEAQGGGKKQAEEQPAPPPSRGDPLGRARELQNLQNKQVQQLDP